MAKIQENFYTWKEWTFKHGFTPKRHSLDKEEDKLANKIICAMRRLKKVDEENPILREYEAICQMYNTGYITRKRRRSPFEIWKEFCETYNRLPKTTSEDKEEARIAFAITKSIKVMEKSKSDEEIVKEYYKIRGQYKLKAKAERRFKSLVILEAWCRENGRLPNYKSEDVEEKEYAIKIRKAYSVARKKPDLYNEFLAEYDRIVNIYGGASEKRIYELC